MYNTVILVNNEPPITVTAWRQIWEICMEGWCPPPSLHPPRIHAPSVTLIAVLTCLQSWKSWFVCVCVWGGEGYIKWQRNWRQQRRHMCSCCDALRTWTIGWKPSSSGSNTFSDLTVWGSPWTSGERLYLCIRRWQVWSPPWLVSCESGHCPSLPILTTGGSSGPLCEDFGFWMFLFSYKSTIIVCNFNQRIPPEKVCGFRSDLSHTASCGWFVSLRSEMTK